MNEMIDFDQLATLQQANVRAAQYELKRKGDFKFNLSNKAKGILGYDESKALEIKAGAGVVVVAIRSKDDARAKFVRGLKNNTFTSDVLENAIVANLDPILGKLEKYKFEYVQDHDDAKWYKLVVPTEESDGEPDGESDGSNAKAADNGSKATAEESASDKVTKEAESEVDTPEVEEKVGESTDNDDF